MYRKVKEHISGRELFTYFYESKGFITEDENGRKIEVHGLKELFQTEKIIQYTKILLFQHISIITLGIFIEL